MLSKRLCICMMICISAQGYETYWAGLVQVDEFVVPNKRPMCILIWEPRQRPKLVSEFQTFREKVSYCQKGERKMFL
jgi:hypothetical protein